MDLQLTFLEYQTLVEQSPILIWRSGRDKLCNYFNQRWLDFTGRTMAEEFGNGWAEGVHPEDFDRCLEIYVTNFEQRKIFEMRYRLKRADGIYRWILDRGVPFYSQKGEFEGYIGSCIDIHKAVEAEMELQRLNDEKIKQLEQLLPMCSWCKKIRKPDGQWVSLEDHVRSVNKDSLTHTICQDCKRKCQV